MHELAAGSESLGLLIIPFQEQRSRDPNEFLRYLREGVSIENLLADRTAQAKLWKIMDTYFNRDSNDRKWLQDQGRIALPISYPILTIGTDAETSLHHRAFMLRDQTYYYYFNCWWPGEKVPLYLKPEDIVPSDAYVYTYPEEIRAQVIKDLRISEREFDYLKYSDPRVTSRAVMKELPFNKPINRVGALGGIAERYNYNSQEWEANGEGAYRPNSVVKAKVLLGRVLKSIK